jgi:hypothetical protein
MKETLSDNRIINYDYIKGVAIVFVILSHLFSAYSVLPQHMAFHIGNSVSLFLITTALLRYKKLEKSGMNSYWINISKELLIVFIPFIFAQLILITIYRPDPTSVIKTFGMGMGAYYPFIHTQMIIMAPFAYKILNKNFILGSFIILSICTISEALFSYMHIPQWTYRILFTRYCFLYVIGFLLLKNDLLSKYKYYIGILTILGCIFIYFHCYHGYNAFFYPGWIGSKFPRDFLSLCWFLFLFNACNYTPHAIRKAVAYMGKKSYDIFIIQMMFFCCRLHISNILIVGALSFILILICSYPWGLCMNKLRELLVLKLFTKKKSETEASTYNT